MKKYIFTIICFLVLFSTFVFAQNTMNRDEAYKIIKQKGLVDTLENTVRVSTQIIPPQTAIKLMIDSLISPASNCWFFLIDLKPYYDWAHPCKYIFLNTTDSSLTIINGQFDAYIPTDVLLWQKSKIPLFTPAFIKKKIPVSKIKPIQKSSKGLLERNYAILINGGGGNPNSNPIRYWNNLSLVFNTLIEKNYKLNNIFVLSSDGINPNSDTTLDDPNDPVKSGLPNFSQCLDLNDDNIDDIAYSATKTNISTVFTYIKSQLALNAIAGFSSNIFIYITDHGYLPLNGHTSADVRLWLWDQNNMSPAEFITELGKLKEANFIQVLMDQCSSGGFSDEIKKTDLKVVIANSCAFNQSAISSGATGNSYYLLEWISGIRGKRLENDKDISYIVDTNHDGFICFEEASEYASKQVQFYNMNSQYYSNPFCFGRYVAIDNLLPEAYCNNGKQDNGETDVDCGGSCGNTCGGGIIINPPITKIETCDDGIKNQDETGIDCGGSSCQPCGYGASLNNIVSVSNCKLVDDQIIPLCNAPSMFSGSNILTKNNLKLSHGGFTINYKRGDFSQKAPVSLFQGLFPLIYKTEWYHIYPNSYISGGIFFEEEGYQFEPNKSYKITFNFRADRRYDSNLKSNYRYSQLNFKLANDLKNVTSQIDYSPNTDNYYFSSIKKELPILSEYFNIGNLNRVDNQCDGSYILTTYDSNGFSNNSYIQNTYNEVSLIFTPDAYYKQLWIYTNDNSSMYFNSITIDNYCNLNIPNYVSINNSAFTSPSIATNWISIENLNYTPSNESVSFIAGDFIELKNNVMLTPSNGASIHIYNYKYICPSNIKESIKRQETNVQENIYLDKNIIKLYPNPTIGIISIDNQTEESYTVFIYDYLGNLLKEVNKCHSITNINLSDYPSGLYAFKISSLSSTFVQKVIKN